MALQLHVDNEWAMCSPQRERPGDKGALSPLEGRGKRKGAIRKQD